MRESLVPKNMPVKLSCIQRFRHTVGRVEVGLDVANLELARKVEGSDVMKLDLDVLGLLEKSGRRRQLDSTLVSISRSGVTLVSITCNSVSKPENQTIWREQSDAATNSASGLESAGGVAGILTDFCLREPQ